MCVFDGSIQARELDANVRTWRMKNVQDIFRYCQKCFESLLWLSGSNGDDCIYGGKYRSVG